MAMTQLPVLDNVEVGDHIKIYSAPQKNWRFAPPGSDRPGPRPKSMVLGEVLQIERRPRSVRLQVRAESHRPEINDGIWQISIPAADTINWAHSTVPLDIAGQQVPIDARIFPLIRAVRAFGLGTDFCCEGSIWNGEADRDVYDSQVMFSSPEEAVRFIRRCHEFELRRSWANSMRMNITAHPDTGVLRGNVRFPFKLLPILTEHWAPGHAELFEGIDLSRASF